MARSMRSTCVKARLLVFFCLLGGLYALPLNAQVNTGWIDGTGKQDLTETIPVHANFISGPGVNSIDVYFPNNNPVYNKDDGLGWVKTKDRAYFEPPLVFNHLANPPPAAESDERLAHLRFT
jgi:hypothetical protein